MKPDAADGTPMAREAVALEAMYRRFREQVLAYMRRRIAWHDAVDATEEVFVVAWRRWDEVPKPPDDLAWLYGVARRVVANQARSNRRRRRLDGRLRMVRPGRQSDPQDRVAASAERKLIIEALSTLSEEDREVLRLAAWEQLTSAEIGVALGVTDEAARQRLHRARDRLVRKADALERRAFAGRRADRD